MKRSEFKTLLQSNFFFWATGIEDTFITDPFPATGRTLDEYELTEHYSRWREDIGLISELGVTHARYGIPWHRINPQPNSWDWSFADQALECLLGHRIEPILDLVHYGLPGWIEGAYLNPDFPRYMAEFAGRAAERYQGKVRLWTPLNEPRVTAWYCGKLGWWPPFARGWKGFASVMAGVCRGIVEASKAIKATDEENLIVPVDATDLYESDDPNLSEETSRRQEIVFLALDLISGRVTERHSLYEWILKQGISRKTLEWFLENHVDWDLLGINLYPLFSKKVLSRTPRLRTSMPYAGGEIVEQLSRLYYSRYQTPLFISETASLGSVARRAEWLVDSVAAVERVRASGIPLIGYTWWPLFALVTWAYRQGKQPPAYYLKQMGLWDLKQTDNGLERMATPLVEQFQDLVKLGTPRPRMGVNQIDFEVASKGR